MFRPSQVSSHFQSLIKRSALPRIRLHDLRHPSASIGLQAGESLKEVSSRLGHSTIVITADIYAHISPELAKQSAERLAKLVAVRSRETGVRSIMTGPTAARLSG